MDPKIIEYVASKRKAGVKDAVIQANLIASGWQPDLVKAAITADLAANDAPVPSATPVAAGATAAATQPAAVVSAFSTISLEYIIMFIALWISASSIGLILHAAVDTLKGSNGLLSAVTPFSSATLIVSLPILALLFIRLKRKEAANPEIRHDESRKQAIRLTLLITFLIGIGHVISYVYGLLAPQINYGYDTGAEVSGMNGVTGFLHLAVTFLIAGGIFIYYWRDIHRSEA
jgi:hypothetical protein